MKIIAKRPFISSRKGIGNVPEGRILDADDDYAESLINAGLAEKYAAGPAVTSPGQSFFLTPGQENPESGPSLPVVQVSPEKTVTRSKRGAAKTSPGASSSSTRRTK